jgi:N-acetylglucosamine-6-phosphate deacetylase
MIRKYRNDIHRSATKILDSASMINPLLITNCVHYKNTDGNAVIEILIEDGRIVDIAPTGSHRADNILNAQGRTIAPGLIDVHIQGAGGSDVLDNTPEALTQISKTLARFGTTSFLGTSVVRPTTGNAHLELMRESVDKDLGGARLLGIHLEGPYINLKKKGGLDPGSIYSEDSGSLDEILRHTGSALKMMTIAPELPGNHRLIKELIDANVIPSFGHSEATYEEAKQAFDLGVPHATHLFNAMLPLNHRMPGPIAAIFESKHVSAQIIADGHHLHPAAVALAFRNLGRDRSICITDGVQGIGLPAGRYFYNGREYDTSSGAARYLDGTLIGAAIGLSRMVVNFSAFTGSSLAEAIDTASLNPARLLGMEKELGSIEPGKLADLILLNDDLSVYATLVRGEVVFHGSASK